MTSSKLGAFFLLKSSRRIASVTISVPLASRHARVCSRLWYFPVPTISRELNLNSPIRYSLTIELPSSDGMNNFNFIAICKRGTRMLRARHDLAVAGNGKRQMGNPHVLEKHGNRHRCRREMPTIAVDRNGHGWASLEWVVE